MTPWQRRLFVYHISAVFAKSPERHRCFNLLRSRLHSFDSHRLFELDRFLRAGYYLIGADMAGVGLEERDKLRSDRRAIHGNYQGVYQPLKPRSFRSIDQQCVTLPAVTPAVVVHHSELNAYSAERKPAHCSKVGGQLLLVVPAVEVYKD